MCGSALCKSHQSQCHVWHRCLGLLAISRCYRHAKADPPAAAAALKALSEMAPRSVCSNHSARVYSMFECTRFTQCLLCALCGSVSRLAAVLHGCVHGTSHTVALCRPWNPVDCAALTANQLISWQCACSITASVQLAKALPGRLFRIVLQWTLRTCCSQISRTCCINARKPGAATLLIRSIKST